MKTSLCFLCFITFSTLFAESLRREERLFNLNKTIRLLHALGPKKCPREVGKTSFDLTSTLPKKGQEILPALKISFKHAFEIFKNNHSHWDSSVLFDLRALLHLQTKTYENSMPVVGSEFETLVKNFENLDQFLTRGNFGRCAWEIVRNEILGVMDHFQKLFRKRHIIL